jgi:urea transporter
MSKGVIFWVGMFIWLVFGLYVNWSAGYAMAGSVLLFVLLALLGYKCFGPPVKE